jgi:two-component system KDP operon response regulator KdpE
VSNSPGRILIVDDEPHVREALRKVLVGRGYDVRTAEDGYTALQAVAIERPDVVLLDLRMPGVDGVEVSRRVRAASRLEIIVVSAVSDEPQKIRALDAGADDYVTKPFSVDELLARVRSAMRRAMQSRTDELVISAGPIVVDQLARRVTIAGQEVHLSTAEYEILRVLASHPDRVMTHRHLLTTALGPHYADALEYLRTLINQIRRKLEPEPRRPRFIITEPGIGYRLRADDVG